MPSGPLLNPLRGLQHPQTPSCFPNLCKKAEFFSFLANVLETITISVKPGVYLGILFTLVTVKLDQWWGLRGQTILMLITLDRWKRHFWEKNYIKNYFYWLKSTNSTKTISQKCWRYIIWADFFWHPCHTIGIKTRLGLLVAIHILFNISCNKGN